MTSWFRLTLCLALLCLFLLHLTQPADINHQLQIVSWGSGCDRGREPAPDALTLPLSEAWNLGLALDLGNLCSSTAR